MDRTDLYNRYRTAELLFSQRRYAQAALLLEELLQDLQDLPEQTGTGEARLLLARAYYTRPNWAARSVRLASWSPPIRAIRMPCSSSGASCAGRRGATRARAGCVAPRPSASPSNPPPKPR